MLKPVESDREMPLPPDERSVGELVHDLVENGKAYAKAELDVVKAGAAARAQGLRLPALLFGIALLLAIGAFAALGVGIALALEPLVGPFAAGLLTFLLMLAAAALLGWIGARKIGEIL